MERKSERKKEQYKIVVKRIEVLGLERYQVRDKKLLKRCWHLYLWVKSLLESSNKTPA